MRSWAWVSIALVVACSSPEGGGKRGSQSNTDDDSGTPTSPKKDAGTASAHCGMMSCGEHATCAVKDDKIECTCGPGYQGDGKTCDDIDECKDPNACAANETCVNLPGSKRCDCNTGVADSSGCMDLKDLCTTLQKDTSKCDPNARCTIAGTGAACASCNSGFTGDGASCTDHRKDCPSECNGGSGSDPNAVCVEKSGKYSCECAAGYDGSPGSCANIDECAKGTDDCDTKTRKCTDTEGGYFCGCKEGYTLTSGKCVDIDECKDKKADLCPTNATCVNDPGSYHCGCSGDFAGDDPKNCYCDLSGWWAMRQDQALCWQARSLNGVTYIAAGVQLSYVWELHHYVYDGENLVDESKSCGEDIDPDLVSPQLAETYSTFIPQETIEKVGLQRAAGSGMVAAPGLVPGSMFTANDQVALTGIDLGPDALHATWPTDYKMVNPVGGKPPAWVDTDSDGEPGLTIWPKVPSENTNPCADERNCYPHYSYPPAKFTGAASIDSRAGCTSVATRSINNFTADVDSCTHMTGEIKNLKAEGRFEGCTLVPQDKWQADFGCAEADWAAATRCTDENIMLLDTQDQSQNNTVSYELLKIAGEKDTPPSCDDVKSALPATARKPTTICPF